ncbi:DUF4255 domain-containing protein [Zooshikella marina]|uniref:DUF4255 domain-containing protein n=1 Tax=Zooshikella ganghwensis TaxID=202772 RepID=UPI001BB0C255|nr:DUF4255 domain-containing protein [Zooshikella ganghwensis]MBU2705429.1 DUF4255 domain-containing protein [Zooshikella ganghwensis]
MLSKSVELFTSVLTEYLKKELGGLASQIVTYPKNENNELKIENNALTVCLINTEEENVLRNNNRYKQVDTKLIKKYRDVRLRIYLAVLSKHDNYLQALKMLSLVITCFQKNHIIQSDESSLDKIKLELDLVTMDFTRQNDIWNALRISYIPSILYRVTLIVYEQLSTVELDKLVSADISVERK